MAPATQTGLQGTGEMESTGQLHPDAARQAKRINSPVKSQPLQLGEIIVHGEAELAIQRANQTVQEFLDRFQAGDFGDIDDDVRRFNEEARKTGGDILGIYEICSGAVIWLISDGKTTEVVLP